MLNRIFTPYPTTLQIYLDTMCNLKCFFCLYDKRGGAPESKLNKIGNLKKAIKRAKSISLSAWGEPLLSPRLPAVLDYVYNLNHRKELIAIVTNGLKLSPAIARMLDGHLADLTISLNAATERTYRRDMGGSLPKTLAVVKSFMGAIKPSDHHKIGIHMVAHTGNIAEIPALVTLANSLNITRVRVDQFMVDQEKHVELSLLSVKREYNAAIAEASNIAANIGVVFTARVFGAEKQLQKCTALFDECHVWADGRVAPCCYNGSLFMGNAYDSSFESVWFGDSYKTVRKYQPEQCLNCPKILPFDDTRTHIYPLLQEKRNEYKRAHQIRSA